MISGQKQPSSMRKGGIPLLGEMSQSDKRVPPRQEDGMWWKKKSCYLHSPSVSKTDSFLPEGAYGSAAKNNHDKTEGLLLPFCSLFSFWCGVVCEFILQSKRGSLYLCPTSYILRPTSYILHPTSYILLNKRADNADNCNNADDDWENIAHIEAHPFFNLSTLALVGFFHIIFKAPAEFFSTENCNCK